MDDNKKLLSDNFLKTLPEKLTCPKCKQEKPREEFGVRWIGNTPARQSYCKSCRNASARLAGNSPVNVGNPNKPAITSVSVPPAKVENPVVVAPVTKPVEVKKPVPVKVIDPAITQVSEAEPDFSKVVIKIIKGERMTILDVTGNPANMTFKQVNELAYERGLTTSIGR